jgi:hypothetical protein
VTKANKEVGVVGSILKDESVQNRMRFLWSWEVEEVCDGFQQLKSFVNMNRMFRLRILVVL